MPSVGKLLEEIGRVAPWDLAESWDRVGLQVGRKGQPARRVLTAVDLNHETLAEGLEMKVDGFITHHPLIFRPLTEVTEDQPQGRLLISLIRNNLFLITAHTNADKAAGGLNTTLAALFGLDKLKILEPHAPDHCKVTVFAPASSIADIRRAMADAGAGMIGEYNECAFLGEGTGYFKPDAGAHPALGVCGELNQVPEIRLEMTTTQRDLGRVLQAVRSRHPYEEPAVDVYPLLNRSVHGLGCYGDLPESTTLEAFCRMVREKLHSPALRVTGDLGRKVRKVAICSGSGKGLLTRVYKSGADVFLTGELDYHELWSARENDLAVIEAGHGSTESIFCTWMRDSLLKVWPPETGLEIIITKIQPEPYLIF